MSLVETAIGHLGAGVALVTLNDPGRRNALAAQMVEGISEVFDRLEADEAVRAVVVTGAPPSFCSGGSLADLEGLVSAEQALAIYEGFLRVARSPLPTVAAVNGAAVGAGFNLAMCCDVRVASPAARFDARFLQLGLHPGGGSTWMVRQAVGAQAAAALILMGQVLDGEEAARVGLAWRCVPDDELLAVAGALATRAATFPRALVARTKETLATMGAVPTHDEAVRVEVDAQLWSAARPEFRERLADLRAQIRDRS